MSDHKPECPMLDEQWPKHPLEICEYCDMIAACEQRVRTESQAWHYKRGYADSLDAALRAVDAISAPYKVKGQFETYDSYNEGRADLKDLAVAVIDALKEKP